MAVLWRDRSHGDHRNRVSNIKLTGDGFILARVINEPKGMDKQKATDAGQHSSTETGHANKECRLGKACISPQHVTTRLPPSITPSTWISHSCTQPALTPISLAIE